MVRTAHQGKNPPTLPFSPMFPDGMKWGRVLDVHSMAWKKMVRTAHRTLNSSC